MTADVDFTSRGSYIRGSEFLSSETFSSIYLDNFENNFRRQLEDCDKLEVLQFNVDHNSFWGGLSNSFLEQVIYQDVPKVLKVFYGSDVHSSFFCLRDDTFNVEKFINYLWFITDLNSHTDSQSLFLPIYKHQNPSKIADTFNYSLKPHQENEYSCIVNDPVYDFYFYSLCGANLNSLLLPMRSEYFNNCSNISNLIHTTSSSLNFIESDTIIHLKHPTVFEKLCSNGIFFNFSRNVKAKNFSWQKLFENATNLNKFNSTVIHGFNEKYKILGQPIDGFLMKHSAINYTSTECMKIPMSFPRKIYLAPKSEFINDLSIMTNYRPHPEFALKNLAYFTQYFKDYDLEIRKYLVNHDITKYIEYKEKIEEFYKLLDTYDFVNENYSLNIQSQAREEFHKDIDYEDDTDI
jgi:hypothetical protein